MNFGRQRHVNIAIAYNVWQYYLVTGDLEFLSHYGAEMILVPGCSYSATCDSAGPFVPSPPAQAGGPDGGPIELSIERQREFNRKVAAGVGYDFEAGRLDSSTHPFTTWILSRLAPCGSRAACGRAGSISGRAGSARLVRTPARPERTRKRVCQPAGGWISPTRR